MPHYMVLSAHKAVWTEGQTSAKYAGVLLALLRSLTRGAWRVLGDM